MSYQVLARKYRPQRFADVVGQDHIIRTLENAVSHDRIAHAYLFAGPRGTGKTTIARIFAKCLNCIDGPRIDFSDEDPRCREIAEGRSLDVLEIDGASNRGIEEIRELRETVRYAPASCPHKIYIIDEVHMLTKEAFNALLKTLEEPPAHAKFMFATTEPEKVLPTILSRCQRFDLRRIPADLIVHHLAQIAAKELVAIEADALHAIARGADGGMRDAESTLDQLISFCGDRIEEENVLAMFGLAARQQICALAQAILDRQIKSVLDLVNEQAQSGKDLVRLLTDVIQHFRNLLVYQASGGDMQLIEGSEAELSGLADQAGPTTVEQLTRILESLTESEYRVRTAASRRIALEMALVKAVEIQDSIEIESVLKSLRDLRHTTGNEPTSPTPSPAPSPAPSRPSPARARSPSQSPESAAPSAPSPAGLPTAGGGLPDLWRRLVEGVGARSQFARSYLVNAFPLSLENRTFAIGFPSEDADRLSLVKDNPKTRGIILEVLAELGVANARLELVEAKPPPDWVAPPPANPSPAKPAKKKARPAGTQNPPPPVDPQPVKLDPQEFKDDPLIKKALETFKGQIVDARSNNGRGSGSSDQTRPT